MPDDTQPQDQTQDPASANSSDPGLDPLQEELKAMTAIAQHALADLQNFRRRAEDERASYIQYANAELLIDLLPTLENINKALTHEPKDTEWVKGAQTTMQQLLQTLEKRGLKAIPAANQPFDPKIHEALMVGPGPKDQILEEFEKGYLLGEKVLKRSRVRVGDGN